MYAKIYYNHNVMRLKGPLQDIWRTTCICMFQSCIILLQYQHFSLYQNNTYWRGDNNYFLLVVFTDGNFTTCTKFFVDIMTWFFVSEPWIVHGHRLHGTLILEIFFTKNTYCLKKIVNFMLKISFLSKNLGSYRSPLAK